LKGTEEGWKGIREKHEGIMKNRKNGGPVEDVEIWSREYD
jgi:hypothetical protein